MNFTPRLADVASPESTEAGVAKSKIVSSGVTAVVCADAGPVPCALVAETVKV